MVGIIGRKTLLKVSDGASTPSFLTVGGLGDVSVKIDSKLLDTSNLQTGSWQNVTDGASGKSITINASGEVNNSTAEVILQSLALSGDKRAFELDQGDGNTLSGEFIIANYARKAKYRKRVTYDIVLESAGEVVLV